MRRRSQSGTRSSRRGWLSRRPRRSIIPPVWRSLASSPLPALRSIRRAARPSAFISCILDNVGRCGHICNASYAVKSGLRGAASGRRCVRHCMEAAKDLGFRVLQFNAVVRTNAPALALYRRLGFVQLGVIPGGFRRKDEPVRGYHPALPCSVTVYIIDIIPSYWYCKDNNARRRRDLLCRIFLRWMYCVFLTAARASLNCTRLLPPRCWLPVRDTHIRVLKSQITLENRHGFAFVSLPRRKVGEPSVVVSIGLPDRISSPRIWMAVEPYPNRWTHHLLLYR